MDATLGVEGLPQSGTGQTTLLTGADAVRGFGRHFGPWVPVRLRPLLRERNVLVRAKAAGRSVAFANAYPSGWAEARAARRPSAPPLAALAAGVLDRDHRHLAAGRAVASEIVNDGWRRHLGRTGVPAITPEQAGANLAAIAAGVDLTLYAHYATDTVGHRGGMTEAVGALERVDSFLGGLLAARPPGLLVLVCSDHGNLEEVGVGHTRNPSLALVIGPDAPSRAGALRDLRDVAPAVLGWLEADASETGGPAP